VTFGSNSVHWYFGQRPPGRHSGEDFLTVALHELGHVLGIGTAPSWFAQVAPDGHFTGAASEATFGGPVPLAADRSHWARHLRSGGQMVVMQPGLLPGERRAFTPLDFAGLEDVGWQVV
jgi:hypothetical protein